MTKNSKKQQGKKKQGGRPKNSSMRSLSSAGAVSKTVPRSVKSAFKIRRAVTQIIPYNPSTGFFAGGPNLQLNFSASNVNVNIGGVGVYGPALPNSSEFASLFDQWRILSVTMRVDYNMNSIDPASSISTPPLLYVVPDYDDSTDGSLAALLQYPAVRTHSFLENGYSPLIYTLVPKPLKDIAGTGLLTSYGPDTSMPFIRTAELSTPHYGVKIATSPLGGTSTTNFGFIMFTIYVDLELANPK